jgi:hypothetical protein
MVRVAKAYQTLWGLAKNPFPDHAVAAAGDAQQPFFEHLYPGIRLKMARAFLGSPSKVAFLWSLGGGDEARGYGKTCHLLWFAARVNEDFGQSAGRLAARGRHAERLVAAYAAFSTVEGVSLSNLFFDVVLNVARSQGLTVANLRAAAFVSGRTSNDIYNAASRRLSRSEADWYPELLAVLCSDGPADWVEYLEEFRQWHKVRYGPRMLRSLVAFLNQVGVDGLLILVDQVEDFASSTTPRYKLQRDLPRLAHLCSRDKLLRDRLTFVLTMHPSAARIVSRYWPSRVLGPIRPGDGADNAVQLGAMNKNRFKLLVEAYLDSVRLVPSNDRLKPFTENAIEIVHELERGRPGYCLRRLFFLMQSAALEDIEQIERSFVEGCLAEEPAL